MDMKAIMRNTTKPGDMSLHEIAVPKPHGHFLLAKVAYAGICASDLHILFNRTDMYKPPVVQGHEFSAIVVDKGEEVDDFSIGDIVTSETAFDFPNHPDAHLLPDYQLLSGKQTIGWTVNGGFAQYVLLNSRFCHKFSKNASLKRAALCEPTAIAAESVFFKGKLRPEDTLVVIGPGPIGVLCALIAKHHGGVENTCLIGLPADARVRLATAKKLGITNCWTTEDRLQALLLEKTRVEKADAVIDATGNIKGYELALDLVKKNGTIVQTGFITSDTMFSWERAARLALNLNFVFGASRRAWEIACEFITSTAINLESLVSKDHPLDKFEQAFKDAAQNNELVKVMFKPNE